MQAKVIFLLTHPSLDRFRGRAVPAWQRNIPVRQRGHAGLVLGDGGRHLQAGEAGA